MAEKKTERVTLWMSESLKVALMHLAAAEDRPVSEYMVHVLSSHAFGHVAQLERGCEAEESGDSLMRLRGRG